MSRIFKKIEHKTQVLKNKQIRWATIKAIVQYLRGRK